MQLTGLLLYQLFAQGQFYYMQIIDINWGRISLLRGLNLSFAIWYVCFYYVMYLFPQYSFESCAVTTEYVRVGMMLICLGFNMHSLLAGLSSEYMRQVEGFDLR